ncbi:MAG: hypothetical protein ACOYVK_14665 [Bacillota bacterium]
MNQRYLSYKVNVDTMGIDFNEYDQVYKARQNYRFDIFLVDDVELEEVIGELYFTIFDLKIIQESYEEELLGYDDEALTAMAYQAIKKYGSENFFTGEWSWINHPRDKVIRKGHLIYIQNLYLYQKYRNKGYGSEIMKNLTTVLSHIFNLDIRGIFGEAAPCKKDVEGNFEYLDDQNLEIRLKKFLENQNFIFLEPKKVDHYFYRWIF